MFKMDVDDVFEQCSYTTETLQYWTVFLKYCCKVTPQGSVYIDEIKFNEKRLGFNLTSVRYESK